MLKLQEVRIEISIYLSEEMLDYGESRSKTYDRGKSHPKHNSTEENEIKCTKFMIYRDFVMEIIWLQRYFTRKMTTKFVFDRGKIIV